MLWLGSEWLALKPTWIVGKKGLPSSARSSTSAIKEFGAHITPWLVLIYEKDSQQVYLWRYEANNEIQTFTHRSTCIYSQRYTDTDAVFLDETKRLVLI